jgi:hypothetical protein
MKTINSQAEFNNSREFVIANSCALEMYMNLLISAYYFGKPNYDFIANVLENQYTNLAFRVSVLAHTFEDTKAFNPYREKLLRLGNIRNVYAHTLPNEIEKDGKKLYLFKNPKGAGFEAINAEVIAAEFYDLFKEMEEWLTTRIKAVGAADGFVSEEGLKFDLGKSYDRLFVGE